jgi:hypothetical protein
MPRRKARRKSQPQEKQARRGSSRKRRKSVKKSTNEMQMPSSNPSNVANITSTSGKTVKELVNDLSLIANQLGNLVANSGAATASAVRQGGQQAERMVQETNPSLRFPINRNTSESNIQRAAQSQEAA